MDRLPESIQDALREEEFWRRQLSVTMDDYKQAVMRLVVVANTDTSSAMPAAQVLLSLYNGYEFHVDLTELGVLDYVNLDAALVAIRGRLICSIEPHEVIEDGDRIFKELCGHWSNLHVSKRYVKA